MNYSPASSSYPSEAFTLPEAYVANVKGSTDEGWYLDSGATHHITNNMANMHVREEFKDSDQLTIGNGQGLIITHIGDACFNHKSFKSAFKHTPITLKDILLVPSITKNLISISKLTTGNNLSIEFVGNVCYVKDSLKGQVLLQGLAEKELYKLLLKSSQSPTSFVCQVSLNQPLSILSTCHVSFSVANNVQNKHSSSKACFQTDVFSCNSLVNKVDLLHRRFSHPYHNVFIHLLKNDQTINLSTSLINQAAQ